MRKMDYDLIVVGGGPAGAAAAKAAVEEGLATLLIEKEAIPRPKPCSGYIFSEAGRFLEDHYGGLPDKVRCAPRQVRKVRLYLHKDKFVEVAEQGQSVWRDKFDQWLCKASGAEVWDRTRMLDFCEWGDYVEVVCTRDGKKVRLRARALVAADGGMSRIRKRIDPGFLEGVPCIAARQEYHRCDTDLEPGIMNVFMNAEYGVYPAAYFKDDLLVIDTSVRTGNKLGPPREAFHSMLARDFGFRSRGLTARFGCVVAFPSALNRFCFGTNRVLVAGEAAGFMNALGEGISSALATGYLAGKAVAEKAGAPPGPLYRERVKPERARTAREWSLPAMMTGRSRPAFKEALLSLRIPDILRVTRAMMAWQLAGGVAPGLQKDDIEVLLRKLLRRSYNFRS